MKAFKITETCNENEYMVGLEDFVYKLIGKQSGSFSFNIVAARVLGFSYPEYLKYVRDNYNATIRGRAGYSYAFYKNRNDCYDIVKVLNTAWSKIEEVLVKKLNNGREVDEQSICN